MTIEKKARSDAKKHVATTLDRADLARLDGIAARQGVSRMLLVRHVLKQFLAAETVEEERRTR